MGREAEIAGASPGPVTASSLATDLQALGVEPGMVMLVHSSLSRLGWVAGGPQAVVHALLEVLGETGTLVMPTHSTHLTEPSRWQNPPVPEAWWPAIRAELPAFNPALTPTRFMGQIVETFRHVPGVARSNHPTSSFAARGPSAERIVASHALEEGLGERSPVGRIYELDGHVLLLGVGHANNTSLHLAEARASWPGKSWKTVGSPVLADGARRWVTYQELDADESDFDQLGAAFAATGQQRTGAAGTGRARLMSQRAVVDFGVTWIERNRVQDR